MQPTCDSLRNTVVTLSDRTATVPIATLVLWGVVVLGGAAGCTVSRPPPPSAATSCSTGQDLLIRDSLYFGRNRAAQPPVRDSEWQKYLSDVLTPRFPDGFTVVNASGQWRGASGAIEHEESEIVTLLHGQSSTVDRAIAEVVAEYKRRFDQEAVLHERATVCAQFE